MNFTIFTVTQFTLHIFIRIRLVQISDDKQWKLPSFMVYCLCLCIQCVSIVVYDDGVT